MTGLIDVLNILLAVMYVTLVYLYGIRFFKEKRPGISRIYDAGRILLVIIIILHAAYFLLRALAYQHAPITNVFEILTLLSFSVTITYLYIELKTGIGETGFFILLIAGVLQIISTIFIKELTEINPVLKTPVLGLHVAFALIGYSAIIISGLYGFLYIRLYDNLKSNKINAFYKKLPSLHLLETLAYDAIKFGFIFLTLTIVIGMAWLPHAFRDFSYTDPKLLATFFIWLMYLIGLVSRKLSNFQSKTVMSLAFYGFLFTILSMVVVNFVLKSFHSFY
jgi:ABC-type transport system involved in cytochrome c biogenesis permease subunit